MWSELFRRSGRHPMGENARLKIAEGSGRISQQVGRLAGINALWLSGARFCLVGAQQGGLSAFALHDDRVVDFRGCGGLRPPPYRSSASQQLRSHKGMEWFMARPRTPPLQKQIPFLSFRSHQFGIWIFWHPALLGSAPWSMGLAYRGSDRLVTHLSQCSPSFRRHSRGPGWTGGGLFRVGTTCAKGRAVSRVYFCDAEIATSRTSSRPGREFRRLARNMECPVRQPSLCFDWALTIKYRPPGHPSYWLIRGVSLR